MPRVLLLLLSAIVAPAVTWSSAEPTSQGVIVAMVIMRVVRRIRAQLINAGTTPLQALAPVAARHRAIFAIGYVACAVAVFVSLPSLGYASYIFGIPGMPLSIRLLGRARQIGWTASALIVTTGLMCQVLIATTRNRVLLRVLMAPVWIATAVCASALGVRIATSAPWIWLLSAILVLLWLTSVRYNRARLASISVPLIASFVEVPFAFTRSHVPIWWPSSAHIDLTILDPILYHSIGVLSVLIMWHCVGLAVAVTLAQSVASSTRHVRPRDSLMVPGNVGGKQGSSYLSSARTLSLLIPALLYISVNLAVANRDREDALRDSFKLWLQDEIVVHVENARPIENAPPHDPVKVRESINSQRSAGTLSGEVECAVTATDKGNVSVCAADLAVTAPNGIVTRCPTKLAVVNGLAFDNILLRASDEHEYAVIQSSVVFAATVLSDPLVCFLQGEFSRSSPVCRA
jgi:hypothetical protein